MEFIARLLIVSMFLYASIVNPFKAEQLKAMMQSKNIPYIDILFPAANVLMLLASIAIIFNMLTAFSAFCLFVYMGIISYYFADFWQFEGNERDMKLNQFTANLTIMGGLLLLILKA